jgi:DNA polymerase III subunit gamma/tau
LEYDLELVIRLFLTKNQKMLTCGMAENFVVSARKYRPVTFDTVVGQSHITTTLKNAVRSKHLAQAFLFCGPRGVGKTTTARILAKTINCTNLGEDVESCGQCDSCVAFQNNASFNVHELDAASNNSVDDIRNLIDQVRYPPQTGKFKIYIIDEVHMLSAAAFNAFLKTLEEPPTYAIFILATTEKHKILPTILSRCQIFDFNRIQVSDMADHLANIANKEGVVAEREALELIAQKADGGLRDALSMFDLNVTFSTDNKLVYKEVIDNLHILDYDYYFKITDHLLNTNLSQSLLVFEEILKKGFDGHLFIVGLLEHFRNLLVSKDPQTVQLLEVSELAKNKYLEQAAKSSMSFLLSALSVGSQCELHYKTSKSQRLHVELCLMKLAHLENVLANQQLSNDNRPTPKNEKPDSISVTREPAPAYNNALSTTVSMPVTPALGKLKTTISLAPTPTPTEKPVTLSEKTTTQIVQSKAFVVETLREVWQDFRKHHEHNNGSINEQVVLDRELTLNGTTVLLTLDNLFQENVLSDLKPELLSFLRQRLQNTDIQIEHKVVVQEQKQMLYSPMAKFNAMAEKNPALHQLRQELGLEVDF